MEEAKTIARPPEGKEAQQDPLLEHSIRVMASDDFQQHSQDYDRRAVIQMANSLGGPRMKLVHSRVIRKLGRIPRSSEGYAEDAMLLLEEHAAIHTEVFFFSHQWLRPNYQNPEQSHPDTEDNVKAKALTEFVQWRTREVRSQHGFDPHIFFWIEFCCHDQDHLDLGFAVLPIWTACCERFLRFETPTYHSRVWCRLEPLLSAKFSYTDYHTVIHFSFQNHWPNTGKSQTTILLDPREGQLTDPKDAEKLKPLIALAVDSQAGRQPVVPGQSTILTYQL